MDGDGVRQLLEQLEALGDQATRSLLEELVACGADAVPPLIDAVLQLMDKRLTTLSRLLPASATGCS